MENIKMTKFIPKTPFWRNEPKRRYLFFISATGHQKPLVNHSKEVIPRVFEELTEELKKNNDYGRVIDIKNYTFVIYKKHYLTRDNDKDILLAAKILHQKHPLTLFKTTVENANIQRVLEAYNKIDIEFHETSDWYRKF